jgi:hypothetical protein
VVVSCFRWLIYERFFKKLKLVTETVTDQDRKKLSNAACLTSYRAAVDETYRYHQFYGGLTITAPALFVGWLNTLGFNSCARVGLIAGFVVTEIVLISGAIDAYKRYDRIAKAILT